jgi:hypothetical protein
VISGSLTRRDSKAAPASKLFPTHYSLLLNYLYRGLRVLIVRGIERFKGKNNQVNFAFFRDAVWDLFYFTADLNFDVSSSCTF